jgi:hypothetical protein
MVRIAARALLLYCVIFFALWTSSVVLTTLAVQWAF